MTKPQKRALVPPQTLQPSQGAPMTLADEVNKLASSAANLFPHGLDELTIECEPSTGKMNLRLKAPPRNVLSSPATAAPRTNEADIEGTAAFRLKWNIKGHEVIAVVAEDLLRDQHPQVYEALRGIYDADPEKELRGSELREYAAWPDIKKKDNKFKARTGKWHYIDIPFDGESDEISPLPAAPHVLSAMNEQLAVLKNSTDAEARADALAFVTHFVGDIHQPLHCVELKNDEFPEGDGGGNKFELARGKNLHSLWDGFIASNSATIMTSAGKLKEAYPRSLFTARLKAKKVEEWIWETHKIGRDAYKEILAEPVEERASDAYREWGRRISREQAALAAYRLADLLVSVLS